jgi:hypothetical protein
MATNYEYRIVVSSARGGADTAQEQLVALGGQGFRLAQAIGAEQTMWIIMERQAPNETETHG